ncbi:MAG: hypothetical protein H0T71_08910, partial [Acidobacteria bacterium]|nr:hypothetical protein [Acidobacteriota bacterium]
RASVALGAGRDRLDAQINLAAGIIVRCKPGDAVAAGDSILELHYDDALLDDAVALATRAITVGVDRPPPMPLVLDHVT